MLTRAAILQAFLDLYTAPSYLEIGVAAGETFHVVQAARKVAVDPKFAIPDRPADSAAVSYVEATSDAYFAGAAERFDVVFIDGMHTAEQATRDLMNATERLQPGGVVVLDDVMPNSYRASLPDPLLAARMRQASGQADPSWMGDVYKLVFWVEALLPTFSYATVEETRAQTVLWRERREPGTRTLKQIAALEFADVVMSPEVYRFTPLETIVERVTAARP